MCFNLTEHKFYVYSQNGILLNRVNFSKQVEKYGEPKDVFSSDGKNFLFLKTYEQIMKHLNNSHISNVDLLKQMMKINMMEANTKKMTFVKDICLYDLIQDLVPNDSCLK
tara:strand:- start:333 stop:662 length:330 start_codon:yes stop_codon:yes gene_type:complete